MCKGWSSGYLVQRLVVSLPCANVGRQATLSKSRLVLILCEESPWGNPMQRDALGQPCAKSRIGVTLFKERLGVTLCKESPWGNLCKERHVLTLCKG